jgi:NAD(P)-dependent dehydrogenase (short-subunit alcohol dehydrogenase family)
MLIHAAGILRDRMLFNMTEEEWDAVIAVHLKGMFSTAKPASIIFRQQRSGRIIGFSSTSGLYGQAGQTNYGAAKDGIAGFVRVVARDLGRYGATVNGIAPAAETRMTATISDEARELRKRAGMGDTSARVGEVTRHPLDVAPLAAYLCTDHAKDINGHVFFSAGGTISLFNNPWPARSLYKQGRWTVEEIGQVFPQTLGKDLVNPAPKVSAKA